MKILVLGAGGFLGKKVASVIRGNGHEVVAAGRKARPGFEQVDITAPGQCGQALHKIGPQWVVNCAGAADVDWCEDHPSEAEAANSQGAKNVARACLEAGCSLLHVYTDYVFDGFKKEKYVEEDGPGPISVYGKTKLAGELFVSGSGARSIIARVAALYGFNDQYDKPTFASKVISNLWQKKPFVAIKDQWNTPTLIDDAASAFCKLMEADARGVYNVAGSECLTRFDFAAKIAQAFGFDKTLIKATMLEKVGFRAPRPQRSCLDVSKIRGLGIPVSDAASGLEVMRQQINSSGALISTVKR